MRDEKGPPPWSHHWWQSCVRTGCPTHFSASYFFPPGMPVSGPCPTHIPPAADSALTLVLTSSSLPAVRAVTSPGSASSVPFLLFPIGEGAGHQPSSCLGGYGPQGQDQEQCIEGTGQMVFRKNKTHSKNERFHSLVRR